MSELIREKLKTSETKLLHLKTYLDIERKKERIGELEAAMANPDFWQDQEVSRKCLQEIKRLKSDVKPWEEYTKKVSETKEISGILDNDEALIQSVVHELDSLLKEIESLEFHTLLNGEFDPNDAILSINAGAGGTESCDWASMLLRMYSRWAERHGYQLKTMDMLAGEEAGIKNVTISIKGDFAYGYLKAESGVHRLVRISPFDANKRRHTSFAAVEVIAEIQDDAVITIPLDEIRIDTYRASGRGGQHVNVTDSAVRITHLPSGIVVQSQSERSQHQNKDVCMKLLKAKLYELKRRAQEEKAAKEYAQKQKIEWGSQIRSYVMHPYNMVKDHRTDFETGNVDAVMDGALDNFIHAYLKKIAAERGEGV